MKELTPEQIQHNYNNLRNIIDVNSLTKGWRS